MATDPVTATKIAQDTSAFLEQVRTAERVEDLKRIEAAYAEYAKAMGVVAAISDHVFASINRAATNIRARSRVVRDPTGDRGG